MALQRCVQDRPAPADARRGRDELLLCGVYAHVGVLATAVEAFTHDIQTFLIAHTTADFSPDHHRSALTCAAERCARGTTAKRCSLDVTVCARADELLVLRAGGAQLYALLHRPGATGVPTTWLEAAVEQAVREPRTMALATSDAQGRSYSRIVAPLAAPSRGPAPAGSGRPRPMSASATTG